jgi:hypothetical protein
MQFLLDGFNSVFWRHLDSTYGGGWWVDSLVGLQLGILLAYMGFLTVILVLMFTKWRPTKCDRNLRWRRPGKTDAG